MLILAAFTLFDKIIQSVPAGSSQHIGRNATAPERCACGSLTLYHCRRQTATPHSAPLCHCRRQTATPQSTPLCHCRRQTATPRSTPLCHCRRQTATPHSTPLCHCRRQTATPRSTPLCHCRRQTATPQGKPLRNAATRRRSLPAAMTKERTAAHPPDVAACLRQ